MFTLLAFKLILRISLIVFVPYAIGKGYARFCSRMSLAAMFYDFIMDTVESKAERWFKTWALGIIVLFLFVIALLIGFSLIWSDLVTQIAAPK